MKPVRQPEPVSPFEWGGTPPKESRLRGAIRRMSLRVFPGGARPGAKPGARRLRPGGILLLMVAAATLGGCGRNLFNVNFFIVGEQTSLEKQVLGTYGALGEDLLLYSSVRGVDEEGALKTPPPATDSQQAAFAAMRNREYNRDDINALLVAGVAGEAQTGLLEWRDRNAAIPEGLTPEQVEQIIEEENRDRSVVLGRLMATVPGIDDARRREVERISAGLNLEMAPAGAWVQAEDGSWSRL